MKLIQTHDLSKVYGHQKANDAINLTLDKGDIYGLIGKNGAGKSTLFKILMGLSTPTSGSIEIMGSTQAGGLNKERRNIGFMIGTNFFPYLSAKENLEYFRGIKGIVDKEEVNRVLRLVELDNNNKPFKAYSLGMKQRLAIANALLGKPDIVILDEPVNGLDPQGIADFRRLITRLNKEYNTTFLISSHILGELGLMCNRYGFIDQGKMIEEITGDELHERTRSALKIRSNQIEKVAVLLEETFEFNAYKVINKDTIILNQGLDISNQIAYEIVTQGLDLMELSIYETSLEEYFLNLIGGNVHA